MLTEKDVLQTELSKLVVVTKNKYWYANNLKRMQRFFVHTLMAFFVQYISILHLTLTCQMLPIYPPIGTALAMFYLFGANAWVGLLLGSVFAYGMHHMSISFIALYGLADIGCGYLSAYYCRTLFLSDLSVFMSTHDWYKFIKNTLLLTCVLSSYLRIIAVVLNSPRPLTVGQFFYNSLHLWLADLNAIIVFAAFLLSWLSVYLKKERILHRNIAKRSLIGLVVFVSSGFLLIKNADVLVLLIICVAFYLAYRYGFLIASLLTYLLTTQFLSYFMPSSMMTSFLFLISILAILGMGFSTSKIYYDELMVNV